MRKRIVSVILALCFLCSLVLSAAAAQPWQVAYAKFLMNPSYTVEGNQHELEVYNFYMYDMDADGLPELLLPGDNILVKASHSMAFEEISEALVSLAPR